MFRDSLCVELGKIFGARIQEYSGSEEFTAGTVYVNYVGQVSVKVEQEELILFEGYADLMAVSTRLNKKSGWLTAKLSDFDTKTDDKDSSISITTIDKNETLAWQSADVFLVTKRIKFNFTESYNTTREKIKSIDLSIASDDNQN
ncbi:hypothetical protein VP236O401_P0022 [Vibrio phage 236O40-1]|nr:hypothetical protein VP236O401_P0022 [Vibrio phage 236O40-1]